MSELKAYRIKGVTLGDIHDVYLKSEADEVIADLKQKMKQQDVLLGKALNNISESHKHVISLAGKCNHSNYKRCLAMAQEWRNYASFCGMQSSCHNHRGFGKTAEKYTRKECHAWRCVKRWLEMAKLFKEEA